MTLEERVSQTIKPTLADLGYSIVRLLITRRQTVHVQIMAEHCSGKTMTVEDCASISRAVSVVLDVADVISSSYTLEVSSPGIDRPLVTLRDFQRFAGNVARVDLHHAIDGRRRFTGRVLGVTGETVHLETDMMKVSMRFENIRQAKLILNDALLKTPLPAENPPQTITSLARD